MKIIIRIIPYVQRGLMTKCINTKQTYYLGQCYTKNRKGSIAKQYKTNTKFTKLRNETKFTIRRNEVKRNEVYYTAKRNLLK